MKTDEKCFTLPSSGSFVNYLLITNAALSLIGLKSNLVFSGCVWLLCYLSCVAVTLVYGLNLVEKYINYPIRTQVVITYNETMTMPAITICPADRLIGYFLV